MQSTLCPCAISRNELSKRRCETASPMPTFASKKLASGTSQRRTVKPAMLRPMTAMGVGIRVIAGGCWGFAATDEISPKAWSAAANLAIEIARSGALAKKRDVVACPGRRATSAFGLRLARSIRFSVPVDENLQLLIAIDQSAAATLRASRSPSPRSSVRISGSSSPRRSAASSTRPAPHRRRLRRPQLQGRRNSEALLSRTPSAASIS